MGRAIEGESVEARFLRRSDGIEYSVVPHCEFRAVSLLRS
jgi:hypothetical protein